MASTFETAPATTVQATTTAAAVAECAHPQTVQMQGGNTGEAATVADIGRLGGAVLVVQLSAEGSRTIVDEDPAPVIAGQSLNLPSNTPYVLTRYGVTATQIVVWPDSSPLPAIGDALTLDVEGGTYGCFTLDVSNAIPLDPGATYLVAAGVRDAHELRLWDASNALPVDGGVIGQAADGAQLSAALAALVGQPVSALPPSSVVHSDLLP